MNREWPWADAMGADRLIPPGPLHFRSAGGNVVGIIEPE
jgi:hypothetical protein